MKRFVKGVYIELSEAEIAEARLKEDESLKEMYRSMDYATAVNTKIRERYTESMEMAILRQREEKPQEFAEYYNYCEECKAFVKAVQQ